MAAWIGTGLSGLWFWDHQRSDLDSGARCVGCEERRPGHGQHPAALAAPFFKAVWATARRSRREPAGARPGAVVHTAGNSTALRALAAIPPTIASPRLSVATSAVASARGAVEV